MRASRVMVAVALLGLLAPLAGCDGPSGTDGDADADGDGGGDGGGDGDGDADADADADGDGDADEDGEPPSCGREPAAADRERAVVVSHPYDATGAGSGVYEVLALSAAGELSQTGHSFTMGRSLGGVIGFTPDGKVGIVAQEDGSLGVFGLDEDGNATVVHDKFEGSFYASGVVVDSSGDRAYVLDGNWREHGGGIYSVRIGCDGVLEEEGLVAPAKLPYGLVPLEGGRSLLAARDYGDTAEGRGEVHIVELEGASEALGSVEAFGDDEAIVSAVAVTHDGLFGLVGDNSGFSGVPNRVAVVGISGTALSAVQVLTPVEDPVSIVASPFDDGAIVVSGFGDAIFALDYDPADGAAPFAVRGELDYEGAGPALPFGAVLLDRGSLEGLVLVAENVGVRRVRFEGGGEVTDLGAFSLGDGYEVIVGTIGVQP